MFTFVLTKDTLSKMTHLLFSIDYATTWGESLRLRVQRGADGFEEWPMHTDDGHTWMVTAEAQTGDTLTYTYVVTNGEGQVIRQLPDASFSIKVATWGSLHITDRWPERPIPEEFCHTAFTECIFSSDSAIPIRPLQDTGQVTLYLRTLPPPEGGHWAVSGEADALGAWRPEALRMMRRTGVYEWTLQCEAKSLERGSAYKYVLVMDDDHSRKVVWEEGGNRYLPTAPHPTADIDADHARMVVHDDMPRIAFERWRGAGIVIPVFSLRSEGSQGCGDFGDLRRLVEWATTAGLRAVQVLPVNDTSSSLTWHDAYPYSCVSVYALHPIYLDLREWSDLPIFSAYAEEATRINALPKMDYEATLHLKMRFLSDLYLMRGQAVRCSTDYATFTRQNAHWLEPYADYAHQKFAGWTFSAPPERDLFVFIQYLLHRQLLAAHDTARACGVLLKGDIPIGVCHDSVPMRVDGRLFHADGQAGAPPDYFAKCGQNWGFPTYNWEEMARDGYGWWRKRLAHMSRYFDAYRLDHVLGFFRIWEIPQRQRHGTLGHFRPAMPLSRSDIQQAGFTADIERALLPYITAEQLGNLSRTFPTADVAQYFRPTAEGGYTLAGEYIYQDHILGHIADEALREALMDMACDVLFVSDPDTGDLHPRICAQQTESFRALSDHDKAVFNRLHDDFFHVRHNAYWADEAMRKLPAIIGAKREDAECSMLPCAEDLGMVPASVKGVLEQLHILSLEIQRMPKTYGRRFADTAQYPYLSVATPATHDMSPIRSWWNEDRERAVAFWHEALHHEGEAPAEATPEVCEEVVTQHLASPSMLCLIAFQDLIAIDGALRWPRPEDEQINDPANANQYWQYRMHLTIEQLVGATAFNEKLRGLVKASGR